MNEHPHPESQFHPGRHAQFHELFIHAKHQEEHVNRAVWCAVIVQSSRFDKKWGDGRELKTLDLTQHLSSVHGTEKNGELMSKTSHKFSLKQRCVAVLPKNYSFEMIFTIHLLTV